MTTIPSISACIVTYKSKIVDVVKAVDSLLACTIPIEVTIVDNDSGSKYRSELAQALTGKPRITIIDSGLNKGFGAGHNLGFMRSPSSEYHILVNPDIRVHPGAIETMITYMQDHPEIGLLAPKVVDEQGQIQYLCRRYPTVFVLFGRRFLSGPLKNLPVMQKALNHYIMMDADYNRIQEPDCLSGCFMVFRSSVFSKLQGFDERFFLYFEDNDITLRAKKITKAIYFPDAVVTHAWEGGARKSKKLTFIIIQSAIKFFNKWNWKFI